VQIASTQSADAKIVVSFIDDETSKNALSVETSVGAGKLINSGVKADTSKLPQYYAVKAQLFDKMNRPVGEAYTLSRYTKAVQDIIATDITAFDEEQVVNLDEDETTNFLVLSEDNGWGRWIPKSLTDVTVGGGKKLLKYTFYKMAGIEDVYLPKTVTVISDNAFNGCEGIQNVYYPSTRADWEKMLLSA